MSKLPRGIRRRGDKFFVDVSLNGERKTATCASLEDAIATQAEIKLHLTAGIPMGPKRRANASTWTLADALRKTLELPKPDGWRGASYEKQATLNVESAIAFMGERRDLDEISRDLIDAWLHDCEANGNSSATVNRKLSSLSKVLRVAVEYGGLETMPRMPKQRKERSGRVRFLTYDEEASLLSYFRQLGRIDMLCFVVVLIETGMRRGELVQVRPQDVDFKNGVVLIHGDLERGTKNGKIRSVPMTARCREALEGRTTGPFCFSLSESEIRHLWDRARAQLGFAEDKDFVLHMCRHTCASRLVQKGVTLPVVKDWMGHSNITTTMRYSHLFPQDLMNAARALERS